jgi:5-formyltetrahydrofolate cyclo-ligase
VTAPTSPGAAAAKTRLRTEMRTVRRAVTDPSVRSLAIREAVRSLPAVRDARVVMVYEAIWGEPQLDEFAEWCRQQGKQVVVPDHEPAPSTVDVVVVPGLAFTADGHRIGQGGGWYDRFLAGIRPDAVTVGVAFREQLVDELPVEPHDVRLHHVVTA